MTSKHSTVDASPTKKFFVEMLTRDIHLEGAILDLLDNCVDGMRRSMKNSNKQHRDFWANITFDAERFSISDNCGGIPWDMHKHAFRMGRPAQATKESESVGAYGIGMKRAIFKIGKHCSISTRCSTEEYKIKITPEWLGNENNDDAWQIPVTGPVKSKEIPGTTIVVSDLNEGIVDMFGKNQKSFSADLKKKISTHYANLILDGFTVTINGETVKPTTVKIAFDKEWRRHKAAIMPFIFKGEVDGVKVYLAIGLTARASKQAVTSDPVSDAGWTVVCNDRIVLYCDRTDLVGWGELGAEYMIPHYHSQYNAIAGIVEFRSDDPSKLPTTTTKMGVDASSPIYRQVKRKMLEGTRMFVDHTNKWKGNESKISKHIQPCDFLSLDELKDKDLEFKVANALPKCSQYKPTLPIPTEMKTTQIAFTQEVQKIKIVSEYLFNNPKTSASKVGAECFDRIYDEAKQ